MNYSCVVAILLASMRPVWAAPLHEVYKDSFLIGAAWSGTASPRSEAGFRRFDPAVLEILTREFNAITPENLMKWEFLQPEEGRFEFLAADEFMAFAEKHGMTVTGHTLVWHSQVPDWLFMDEKGDPVSREVLIERMRKHIHAVVGRYKGRIEYWDVVNEAVGIQTVVDESLPLDEKGNPQTKTIAFYRNSPWRKIIGDDYIELAFRFAHEADPQAKLLYNDYSMASKPKSAFVAEMFRSLRTKGLPVHGIGMQGHWRLERPTPEDLAAAIDLYAAAGAKISITELDIGVLPPVEGNDGADISANEELRSELNPYTNGVPPEVLQQQADRYRAIFEVLLAKRRDIERVTFWCVSDKDSWLNNWPVKGRVDHPLLFDRENRPKPAYDAINGLLTGSLQ